MRTTTTLTILLMATWASAQIIWPYDMSKRKDKPQAKKSYSDLRENVDRIFDDRSGGSVLYIEDFESGLNGWTVATAAGNVEWTLTSTGNTGGYSPGPLESTTGFPGGSWMTADSDAQGTPGIQEVTTLTSPPITGLDNYPSLILEFEQSFRQLNDDQTVVEISPDGGTTWTNYPVNTEIVGNQSTPGAPASQLISINMTDALNGGSADIRIRFRWVSFEGYTYAWNVDDISVSEAPGNDVVINGYSYSEWFFDQASDFSTLEYSVYPVNLLRPLSFKTIVTNNGTIAQTGVHLVINVDGPGGNDFNATSASVDLQPGGSDSLVIDGYTPPGILGDYDLTFDVVQDQIDENPANNSATANFKVSQHEFARDLGSLDGIYDNQGGAYELGNWFNVNNWGSTLYAVDVALSDQSDPGALIIVILYDADREYITESEEYLVQASDLNGDGGDNFVSLALIDPVVLDQDEDYLIVVKHFGGSDNVVVGTSGVSLPQTSLLFDTQTNDWFYVTSTPMVRMNLDPSVSIAEHNEGSISEMTIYPNPASSNANVRFELLERSKVELQLLDATGRTVWTEDLGYRNVGPVNIDLNTAGVSTGLYSVVLRSANGSTVQQLMVE